MLISNDHLATIWEDDQLFGPPCCLFCQIFSSKKNLLDISSIKVIHSSRRTTTANGKILFPLINYPFNLLII
jgi:hypothetical protein